MRQVEGISILSERLLFNAMRAIMQIYYGKNETRFDDDDDDDDDDDNDDDDDDDRFVLDLHT